MELTLFIPSLVSTQQICYQFPIAFPAVLQLVLRSKNASSFVRLAAFVELKLDLKSVSGKYQELSVL